MSLYHEAADVLSGPGAGGGNLKSRIFKRSGLKSPPAQVYALALETCKWSEVLKEVVEKSELLRREVKLTPTLALLLTHDHLLAKSGIALPASHGLRASIERHKARIAAEFTRARVRRKCASTAALKTVITSSFRADEGLAPRWVRVNELRTTVDQQLSTTFAGFRRAESVEDVMAGQEDGKVVLVDEHVPGLLAVPQSVDLTRTTAYKNADIILQDKASCFPAYLLDPRPQGGDVIDACAAPGNKTTHIAAILHAKSKQQSSSSNDGAAPRVLAFEKDPTRAATLEKRARAAGAGEDVICVRAGKDFLKADPLAKEFANVTALLLDPSCSGSGMLNRDFMPELHLPCKPPAVSASNPKSKSAKKRKDKQPPPPPPPQEEAPKPQQSSPSDPPSAEETARIEALAAFQLSMLTHALSFPAARRITYSTCSIHDAENEHVAAAALASDVARKQGWRVLRRDEQVDGLRRWDVRGRLDASGGDEELAEGCLRTFPGDGRGVMGFFAVGFVRDGQ